MDTNLTNDGVILLVEDDPNLAQLAVTFLQQEEFTDEVVLACDGIEACDYLFHPERGVSGMPGLVLLDINMPRMDGFEVLRKIRAAERTRSVPVVMLTSTVHPEDVSRAYRLGANGYLDKMSERVRWDEMLRTVARYWLGMNITPHSLVGQSNGFARRS
jgi:two-component system, response regulator